MDNYNHITDALTPVFIKDKETGYFTAFYVEFPNAVSQGRDKKEAFVFLNEIFTLMMNETKEDFLKKYNEIGENENIEYYPQMAVA